MARKRKGGNAGASALFPLVILIGLLAQIPKPVWIVLAVGAAVGFVCWLIFRPRKQAVASSSTRESASLSTIVEDEPLVSVSVGRTDSSDFQRVRLGSSSNQTYAIPKSVNKTTKARWLGINESVEVAGLNLPGGLIYVASNGEMFGYEEPSLIDTSLRVLKSPVDTSIRQMGYWPAYNDITPEARRGYLQWQADGRSDPEADVGYVFLFFYGLERRALIDAAISAEARADVEVIQEEVRRLLGIYGGNNSFRGYATRFLDHLMMHEVVPQTYLQQPHDYDASPYELPMPVRIAIGQMAVDKVPLKSAWALAWALNDPNITRRTSVTRCGDKFGQMFMQEFDRRHPNGIALGNNKTRLKIAYRPASARLSIPDVKVGDLPDVSATSGTRNKLQALVDQCSTTLDPYSRYLGRNPDNPDSLEALLQLPITLWPAEAQAELEMIRESVGLDTVCMSFGELAGRFKSAGALSRDKVVALARALEACNVGFEPDVLSGARTPKAEDTVALFGASPSDGTLRADDNYNAAVVTLDLASAVAAADGDTSLEEVRLLTSHVDSWTHLEPGHRKRLNAHLALQLRQPPTLASLKKKLEPLGVEAKRKIASFLSHLAHADGEVTPDEVKLLERVYKALSLDPKLVYSDLHSAASGVSAVPEPGTSLEQGSAPRDNTTIKDATTGTGFALDMSKIAQLQRETAEVSALLAGVFADDNNAGEPGTTIAQSSKSDSAESTETSHGASVYGLDIDHSALLRLLVGRKEWSRAELEDAAADLDLMLDGALEQINDMAFDRFDMPLCEGDDPIEINPEILKELAL
ncbi:Tellurite resistance protein TerB [Pseudomonas sp. NFACC09-4]|uniref:TerB N-terminal domain-containing protein n=1 Tax=Pseudomonas TaxID=286 RepID=UPI00090893C0|nr:MULTISPECIES: TerB N-terminal domain-containing protein [Pseudomonas]NHN68240.1 Tellurite resistance protein TerB [Pseudomonas fluorescens]SFW48883.1 Tellurite resistance protein TerB [Pseudomonas sp. NFACC09-4]